LLTYQNNNERLITERFSKSVEQLGSNDISVRIGGIYALERIAKDSPKDHWTIMEVLTAFVRQRSPLRGNKSKKQALSKVTTDVQWALTAIVDVIIIAMNSRVGSNEIYLCY
jgi:hypothetical protein